MEDALSVIMGSASQEDLNAPLSGAVVTVNEMEPDPALTMPKPMQSADPNGELPNARRLPEWAFGTNRGRRNRHPLLT